MIPIHIPQSLQAGVATYPPGATFGPRVTRDYEFVWMIDGDAEYRQGDAVIAAPAGSILLCRPGPAEFFQWDRHRRTRHGYFHFGLSEFPEEWPDPDVWPQVRVMPEQDILRPLFRHLLTWQALETAEERRQTISQILSVFLSGRLATGSVSGPGWPEPVERACDFLYRALDDDPAQSLTLSHLADAACVSPEYLCRLFKNSVGHSPAETVRLARLDRAAGLLARSNYTVAEIAALCGFSDPFHFSRAFKHAYGQTPSSVRTEAQSGADPPLPRVLHYHARLPSA